MKNIVNKILILIAILGIVISQSIVFANNVGLDPNGHIEMPMSIKTNRAETIGIKNLQNYQLSYQLVETPSENYKKYIAFIDESNEWTVYTEDGSYSAQWEVTVAVTEDGYEVLAS